MQPSWLCVLYNWSYCRSKFYILKKGFSTFLLLWPSGWLSYTNLTRMPSGYRMIQTMNLLSRLSKVIVLQTYATSRVVSQRIAQNRWVRLVGCCALLGHRFCQYRSRRVGCARRTHGPIYLCQAVTFVAGRRLLYSMNYKQLFERHVRYSRFRHWSEARGKCLADDFQFSLCFKSPSREIRNG